MRERLEQRLAELNIELDAGHKMAAELDARRTQVQATMLRIAGAIQVIEELLRSEPRPEVGQAPLATAPAAGNGIEHGERTA